MERYVSILGLGVFVLIGYLWSSNRRNIHWWTILGGVTLQMLLFVFIFYTPIGQPIFQGAQDFFVALLSHAQKGASFVFGPLVDIPVMGGVFGQKYGFLFAFQVSAVIILMASLSAVLYQLKILQAVVWVFAKLMHMVMRVSGAESLSCAANIFVGQTEAPLFIRPYLNNMTSSEIMAVMTGGFATIAGGVFAAYVGFGVDAGHLLTASVLSAPAALVMAKLMLPESGVPETEGKVPFVREKEYVNVVDAACGGAREGLYLSFNVIGMLIAFIALISIVNGLLAYANTSLETLFGYIYWPIAWLMGAPVHECGTVGMLLGKRMVFNEFMAYVDFASIKSTLSERSQILLTYALCGFANFSSIAIQIGGIGTLIPNRKHELARIGFRAMIAGTIASLMTANIAGMFIS